MILKTQKSLREAQAPGHCVAFCWGSLSFISLQPAALPMQSCRRPWPPRERCSRTTPPPVLVSGARRGLTPLCNGSPPGCALGYCWGVHQATSGGHLPSLPGTPGEAYWTLPSLQGTLRPTCWDIPRLLQSCPAPSQSPLCNTGEKTEASSASALREQTTEGQNRNKPSSPRSPQSDAFALPSRSPPRPPHLLRRGLTQRGQETLPRLGAEWL